MSFRRWYERQLLESHAWLVSCILCAVAVAVLAAGYLSFRRLGLELLVTLGAIYTAGLLSLHAWRRYSALMAQAQHRRRGVHVQCVRRAGSIRHSPAGQHADGRGLPKMRSPLGRSLNDGPYDGAASSSQDSSSLNPTASTTGPMKMPTTP